MNCVCPDRRRVRRVAGKFLPGREPSGPEFVRHGGVLRHFNTSVIFPSGEDYGLPLVQGFAVALGVRMSREMAPFPAATPSGVLGEQVSECLHVARAGSLIAVPLQRGILLPRRVPAPAPRSAPTPSSNRPPEGRFRDVGVVSREAGGRSVAGEPDNRLGLRGEVSGGAWRPVGSGEEAGDHLVHGGFAE